MSRDRRTELDDWVLATAPRAVAYAASLLRDRSQAEDVVQDCYCRLLQKSDQYDLPRDGAKILFQAITNACINATQRARPVVSFEAFRDGEDGAGWEPADGSYQEPERVVMHRELESVIAEGLAHLPPLQRAALELKSLGHSQQEVADMLNVTPSHAGVLIHRGRRALAEHLAPYVGEAAG